jgi:hypothetical protein
MEDLKKKDSNKRLIVKEKFCDEFNFFTATLFIRESFNKLAEKFGSIPCDLIELVVDDRSRLYISISNYIPPSSQLFVYNDNKEESCCISTFLDGGIFYFISPGDNDNSKENLSMINE